METVAFKPARGVLRVLYGADPRVEITPARPYRTSNPHEIAELRQLEHLIEFTPAAPKPKASKPKKGAPAAAAPTTAAPGGESA